MNDTDGIPRGDAGSIDGAPEHGNNFTLSLLLEKTQAAEDLAERERISNPPPVVPPPAAKRRQPRSTVTLVVSILTVLALVAVGILFAVKSLALTPEQKAFEAYAARQTSVQEADRRLTSSFEVIAVAKSNFDAVNVAAAAALAAVVGVSDEPARAAADAQRIAAATIITGITVVDPGEAPYVAPKVAASSSLTVIARGLDEVSAEATRIETAQLEVDAALAEISDARASFTTAFTTFTDTIPATATALLKTNPDAAEELRDALTTAVTALTKAADNGQGAAELQAYAAAAKALRDENAYVLQLEREAAEREAREAEEEEAARRAPTRPGSPAPDGGDPTNPPSNPDPAPQPQPEPEPKPEPEPEPKPEPRLPPGAPDILPNR